MIINIGAELAGNVLVDLKPTLEKEDEIPHQLLLSHCEKMNLTAKEIAQVQKALPKHYHLYLIKTQHGLVWKNDTRRATIVFGKEVIKSEAFDRTKRKFPRFKGRFFDRLTEIYHRFTPYLDDPDAKGAPSKDFEDLFLQSRTMVNRSKKALGIKSFKDGDVWYWTFPKRAPSQALSKIHDRKMAQARRNLPHENIPMPQVRLIQVMEKYNYDCPNTTVFQEVGYCRSYVIRAKSALGIVTIRGSATKTPATPTRWIYPAPEVQEWIHRRLADGPVPETELLSEAAASTEWSVDVLQITRKSLGIRAIFESGIRYWEI